METDKGLKHEWLECSNWHGPQPAFRVCNTTNRRTCEKSIAQRTRKIRPGTRLGPQQNTQFSSGFTAIGFQSKLMSSCGIVCDPHEMLMCLIANNLQHNCYYHVLYFMVQALCPWSNLLIQIW